MLTVDGLAANSSAGDTVILSIWGIGDNIGDTDFTATYGGNTAAEGNTQTTIYNLAGEPQLSAVGSNPFVNFTFVADGTDQIRFDIAGAGSPQRVFSSGRISSRAFIGDCVNGRLKLAWPSTT